MNLCYNDSHERFKKSNNISIENFKGLIFKEIDVDRESIAFICDDNRVFIMLQTKGNTIQDYTYIESIVGDINDLVGTPILLAEECSAPVDIRMKSTPDWTFYKLATIKGYVDIRWVDASPFLYSAAVGIVELYIPHREIQLAWEHYMELMCKNDYDAAEVRLQVLSDSNWISDCSASDAKKSYRLIKGDEVIMESYAQTH